jgi:hypothetical protein
MCLQRGQRERVERQELLSVLGLAVRLDHPAVHDDPGDVDRESSGVQIEQVPACTSQLAALHARGRFEHDPGQPLLQRVCDLAAGRADYASLLLVGHSGPVSARPVFRR